MTKAELKKKEKIEFVERAYGIIMKSILEQSRNMSINMQIRVTYQNNDRFIHFHIFGKDISVFLYSDGKVFIELEDIYHSKHREELFDYDRFKAREEFLDDLKEMMAFVILDFLGLGVEGFAGFMGYVEEYKCVDYAYEIAKRKYEEYYRNE